MAITNTLQQNQKAKTNFHDLSEHEIIIPWAF